MFDLLTARVKITAFVLLDGLTSFHDNLSRQYNDQILFCSVKRPKLTFSFFLSYMVFVTPESVVSHSQLINIFMVGTFLTSRFYLAVHL